MGNSPLNNLKLVFFPLPVFSLYLCVLWWVQDSERPSPRIAGSYRLRFLSNFRDHSLLFKRSLKASECPNAHTILSFLLPCHPPCRTDFGEKNIVATYQEHLPKDEARLYAIPFDISFTTFPARVSPYGQLLLPKSYMFQVHMSISETSLSLKSSPMETYD